MNETRPWWLQTFESQELEAAMKKIFREIPVARSRAKPVNPLRIITVMLAVFLAAAAALIALG